MSPLIALPTSFHVHVRPVALASALDYHQRRTPDDPTHVIGALLGTVQNNTVHITDLFPVPHSESGDQVALDMDFYRTMSDLKRRLSTHPRESVMGWFSTGKGLSPHAVLIHEFFAKECETKGVHIVFEIDGGKVGGMRAFLGANVGVEEKPENTMLVEVPVSLDVQSTDIVPLHILSDANEVTPLPNTLQSVESALRNLSTLLSHALDTTNAILSGDAPADPTLGYALMHALESVPTLDPSLFSKEFNSHMQDVLMTEYLTQIVKSQVALTEAFYKIS